MNKLAILAFVAVFAAVARAELDEPITEARIIPTDDEEVADLDASTKVFEPFCIAARDNILSHIKVGSNEAAANVFVSFFKSAGEVAASALDTQMKAVEILGNQVANPDAKIDETVDEIIREGQEAIQKGQTQPRGVFEAVKATLKATAGTFGNSVSKKLDALTAELDYNKLLNGIFGMCKLFETFDKRINSDFESFRDELVAAGKTDVAQLKLANVPCVTTKRIARLDALCNLAVATKNPLGRLYRGH